MLYLPCLALPRPAGHDSSLHIASFSAEAAEGVIPHQVIRFRELPMTCLTFVSEKAVVGAGHDFNPLVFTAGVCV